MRNVLEPDSDLSVKLGDMLNRSIAGVGNWRKLAYKLGVPSSEYNGWDPAATKTRRSPTKLLLEWLRTYKQDLKLDTLAEAMRKIERNDAVKILMRYIPDISSKCVKGNKTPIALLYILSSWLDYVKFVAKKCALRFWY